MKAQKAFATILLLVLIGTGTILFLVNMYQAIYRINYPQSAITAMFVLLSMSVFIAAMIGVARND